MCPAGQQFRRLKVLVLVPTTGSVNRVVRIDERPDLPASQVIVRYAPEAISRDYDALTAQGGPLAKLGPPVKHGIYQSRLTGPIDSGSSWELPALNAHMVVKFGHELATDPSQADIVLWSTGAVDIDLCLLPDDYYRLKAKIDCSLTTLEKAAKTGARIIAILPTGEDASEVEQLLAKAGAQNVRVETVDSVLAARSILEEELGCPLCAPEAEAEPELAPEPEPTPTQAPEPAPPGGTRVRGLFGKIPGLLAVALAAAVALPTLAFLPRLTSDEPSKGRALGDITDPDSGRRQRWPASGLRQGQPYDPPLVPAPPSPAVIAECRVALVIGNAAHRTLPALANPRRDVEAVTRALMEAGFQTVIEATDVSRGVMVEALRRFRAMADRADWALIYYVGHGIVIDSGSYLIPADVTPAHDLDVQVEALPYDVLQSAASGAKALQIVMVDARRGNPPEAQANAGSATPEPPPGRLFMHAAIDSSCPDGQVSNGQVSNSQAANGQAAGRQIPRGLADTLAVYSARDGQVAEDGKEVSPFAQAFITNLKKPGTEVPRVFDSVRDDVVKATEGRQQPFTYGSLSGRTTYYFVRAK
jgi:hypothetical protein